MEQSSQPEPLELSDYLAAIRRRWATIALAGFLGLAAAIAYTVLAPKTYTATAAVFVTGSTGGATQIINGRTTGVVDLDTEAQIVQSAAVAQIARQILHSPRSVTALTNAVSVTVPANSQVLKISCSTHNAVGAARCSRGFAEAYLQNRNNTTATQIKTHLAGLQQQAKSLQQKITSLNALIRSLPRGSGPRVTASTQLSLARNQLTTLSSHIGDLTAQSVSTSGGRIITDAVPPSSPSNPRRSLYLPSGLAAGILIGLIIAFWRDRSDKRVRGPREVEALLDLPVLLHLPPDQRRARLAIYEPRTRTGQAFAELAHSLAATLGQGNHVMLVAPASEGHAGSVTAANLAVALARTGADVSLVCADLRGRVTPALFGLGACPGLAEVVLDQATVGDVEQRPAGIPHLWVITAGIDRERAVEHIERDVTERLVSRLHAVTRYVIFEVAPGAYSADVFPFAELADAAVVAVEVARTLRPDVEETVRRLDKMGAAVLGAVLLPSMAKAGLPPPPRPAVTPPQALDSKRRQGQAPAVARQDSEPADHLVYPTRRTDKRRGTAGSGDDVDMWAALRETDATAGGAAPPRPLRPLTGNDTGAADGTSGTATRG